MIPRVLVLLSSSVFTATVAAKAIVRAVLMTATSTRPAVAVAAAALLLRLVAIKKSTIKQTHA